MPQRAIVFTTRISTVLLALSLVLAFASIWLNPWQHRLSLSDDFHAGIQPHGLDWRIVFFNNAD